MKVHYVTHQIDAPAEDGSDFGRITEGHYIIEAGELVMTNADGEPVHINGREFRHKLAPGEVPSHIAKRLTGEIFRLVKGDTSGRRRLAFPNVGIA
jgi:hypothetical protein